MASNVADFVFTWESEGFYQTAPGQAAEEAGQFISRELYDIVHGAANETQIAKFVSDTNLFLTDMVENYQYTNESVSQYWTQVGENIQARVEGITMTPAEMGTYAGNFVGQETFNIAIEGGLASILWPMQSYERVDDIADAIEVAGPPSDLDINDIANILDSQGKLDDLKLRTPNPDADFLRDAPNKNTLANIQDVYPRPYINVETQILLGAAPESMKNAHIHHILEVNGRAGEHRALVREGQEILRNYDIDPLQGIENLTWAPNTGHTEIAAQNLVEELRSAQQAGLSRDDIIKILKDHGQQAAGR
jgi:hypothetical protein